MSTVLIPSAGTGSRLGSFTAQVNKGQITVGEKPVISYVIEKFKPTDKIIICIGYQADYLKQVINGCFPGWNITFVEVDKWEGPGAGMGYSLLQARDYIKEPFFFFCNDGIIDDNIDDIPRDKNLMFGYPANSIEDPKSYRNIVVKDGKVMGLLEKGHETEDSFPCIGIDFIKDWEDYFAAADKDLEHFISSNEIAGLQNLKDLNFYECPSWVDTGNLKMLSRAKTIFKNEHNVNEDPANSTWLFKDHIVEFSVDENKIKERLKELSDKNILFLSKNVISYSC